MITFTERRKLAKEFDEFADRYHVSKEPVSVITWMIFEKHFTPMSKEEGEEEDREQRRNDSSK